MKTIRQSKVSAKFAVLGLVGAMTGAAVPAAAADLPTAKPAPMFTPVPVYNWSGFYVGVNAGVGWGSGGNLSVSPALGGVSTLGFGGRAGFAGGGQLGYNIQAGAFVYGVETDIDGVAISSNFNWGPYTKLGLSANNNGGWLGTTRA